MLNFYVEISVVKIMKDRVENFYFDWFAFLFLLLTDSVISSFDCLR